MHAILPTWAEPQLGLRAGSIRLDDDAHPVAKTKSERELNAGSHQHPRFGAFAPTGTLGLERDDRALNGSDESKAPAPRVGAPASGCNLLTVHARDVPCDMMSLLLDYCYTGELSMRLQPPSAAVHLMLAAERYGITRLRDRMVRLALRAVDENNALELLQVAESEHSPVLRAHVLQFILRHAEGVLASNAAPRISLELAAELLSSDDLCLQSEELLFRFLLRWGLAN